MAGTFSRLLYHVVFSTKSRTRFIDPKLRTELYPYLEGIIRRQEGWLLSLGGMPDHLHLLLRLKPDRAIADLVRHVKGGSSKWIHEQNGLCPDFAWQSGYAAFSVSESKEGTVRSYIEGAGSAPPADDIRGGARCLAEKAQDRLRSGVRPGLRSGTDSP
jgi:putative transposase